MRYALILASFLLAVPVLGAKRAPEWNDMEIQWLSYDIGLDEARAQNKPLFIVVYTDWCPACHEFSNVFQSPQVVELARRFVMVRVNADTEGSASRELNVDGDYIPRVFFVSSRGVVFDKLRLGRRHAYSAGGTGHRALLRVMGRALSLSRRRR